MWLLYAGVHRILIGCVYYSPVFSRSLSASVRLVFVFLCC